MTNLVVVEIDYMEGPPDLWYSVVDRDVKDRTHVVAGFLDKAEADEYVARKRAAIEPKSPEAQAPESELLAAARGVLRFRAGDHADSWENFEGSDDAWDEMKEAAFNRLILAVEAQGAEKSEGGR